MFTNISKSTFEQRFLLIAFYMLFFVISISAQTLKLRDEITHAPIVMANIFSSNHLFSTASDVKGEADISTFSQCDSIFVKYIGYTTALFSYEQLKEKKFTIYLKQRSISLDEMVVSATRWQQKKTDIPNKITTIKARDITIQNPQTTADLLGQSGDVYIQKSQFGGGSPMIRGFATNRVLISVDGIRMNNAIFRSGNIQNVISLDPFAINQTEVIFGPGSIIYGSDAIGGVMSFYTLKPEFSANDKTWFNTHATVRYASANDEKTGHFDFNTGLKKWAFTTSVTFSDYGDLKMGKQGPDDYLRKEYVIRKDNQDEIVPNSDFRKQVYSDFRQINLMQKIRFKPNEFWTLNYDFHYSTTDDYPRYDRLIRYRDNHLKSAEWYYGPQTWMMNHLYAHNKKKTKIYDQMIIHLAQQYFRESRHDRNFNSDTKHNRTETVNALNLNLDFEKSFNRKHHLTYGTEFIFNKVGSVANDEDINTSTQIPAATRYPDGSTWNSMAIFGDYRYKLTERTDLKVGSRYNYVILNADFDTQFYPFPFDNFHTNTGALTGSLGLVYNPDETMQLMANFATGFRAPNIDDAGKVFDSEPGSVVVPNPDLKSEYSFNSEIGITKVFAGKVKLDFSAYYTNLTDAMIRTDYTLNGQDSIMYDGEMSKVQAIQNAAKAYVYGIQAGIEWKLPLNLAFSSRFNIMKGEEELENGDRVPLRHATPCFGITHITYSHNHIKLDLYATYNGEVSYENMAPSEISKDYMYAKDINGNPYSPSWYTLNLKSLYRINDNLILTAGVENFTNIRYRPYSSGITAAGINFIFAIKAYF
jgi:hemoglobin/transferrin/lactoferrin receptor protein